MTQLSIGWRNAQNRARVLEAADRERFISLLNRTLQTTYPRLELRIFTRPAGLGNDAALFSRARMVVAVHGMTPPRFPLPLPPTPFPPSSSSSKRA